MATGHEVDGPTAARAMKFSVSVVNCSSPLKRAGRVTYINSSQRMAAIGANNNFTQVITAIKSSPYRRRITGDLLSKPTHLIGYPVDNTFYNLFNAFRGTLTADQFMQYTNNGGEGVGPVNRSMSIVAYVFDPVTDHQDYSLTVRASFYTRWPLTSVPGHHMKNIPTADAKIVNHVRDSVESTANDLAHIVEGGALATMAPKAAGVARAAAGRLASGMARAPVAAAAEGAAAEAAGLDAAALLGEALPIALAPFGL